jgi:hypothetical protein
MALHATPLLQPLAPEDCHDTRPDVTCHLSAHCIPIEWYWTERPLWLSQSNTANKMHNHNSIEALDNTSTLLMIGNDVSI